MKNFHPGYIPSTRTETDYIKGVNSPLVAAAFPGFDWRTVRPALDLQLVNGFESNGCVSWTAVQTCEELLNAQIKLGQVPTVAMDFLKNNGYLVNGLVVASKAYIWTLSGTTTNGNSFPKVADALHHNGLIPESMYPFKPAPGSTWAQNFIQPTAAMLAMGQQFLQHFDINYHYLTDQNFTQHLQDGPIQCAIPVCAGYNTDTPVQACNQPEQHSVMIDFVDPQNEKEIVDHYNPEVKLLSSAYPIPDSMQYVVTAKGAIMQLVNDGGTIFLVASDKSFKIGIGDQQTLGIFGNEQVTAGSTAGIPQTGTLASGVIFHK